jgi:hypothetical protein
LSATQTKFGNDRPRIYLTEEAVSKHVADIVVRNPLSSLEEKMLGENGMAIKNGLTLKEHEINYLTLKGVVWAFNIVDGLSHLCLGTQNIDRTTLMMMSVPKTLCGFTLTYMWGRDVDPTLLHPLDNESQITCNLCIEILSRLTTEDD